MGSFFTSFQFYLIGLAAFDIFVMVLLWYNHNLIQASLNWPSVPGRITESRISKPRQKSERPWVFYKYEVNGKPYTYSGINPGTVEDSGLEYAQQIVARYPNEKDVAVYYNPKNPRQAYLEKTTPKIQKNFLFYLVIFNILFVLVMPFLLRLFGAG